MNALPQTTTRRLKKIPQIPSVWEGDRRSLSSIRPNLESDSPEGGECIIWVDGSEGFVRAMDVVSPDMGPEAIVRTLLRAIENPHSPAKPARPQKIVVRNREIQFFLRGALQSLDIAIDYVPELPLIDELFRGFEEIGNARPPALPPQFEPLLKQTACDIWQEAPWDLMADYDILSLEINRWDVGTLHACVMGMLGREYGIILYRSLESLKLFRSNALSEKSAEQLEKAFLAQDCWFLNFEAIEDLDDDEEEDLDLSELSPEGIRPAFGSIHPYEGIRPFLDEEEAIAVYTALQALLRFFRASQRELAEETIGSVRKRFRFSPFPEASTHDSISVSVATLPELSAELLTLSEFAETKNDEQEKLSVQIREDLVPDNAFLSLGMVPWDLVENLRTQPKTYYQPQGASSKGEGMPVILIQTSRPKAKELIETLQTSGGLKTICFNPGEDPFTGISYDLGILQTGNGDLYIFGEFISNDPEHLQARKKWNQRCQKTNGYCGLIVAMGVTGTSRGNPQLQDMMALFEGKAMDSQELAMGVLQLMPEFEF